DGKLTSNHFAIADFGAPAPGATSAATGASDGRVFPADPLPFDGLKQVDFSLGFSAKDAILPKVEVANLEIQSSLDNGKLSITPFEAQLAGGSLHVEANVDSAAKPAAVALKMTSRQVDVDQLLRVLRVHQAMFSGGKADLDLDVAGSGNSVRA